MMKDKLRKLKDPFPPEDIYWRVGAKSGDKKKGLPFAYIDARAVLDRLDEVFGGDWQSSLKETSSGRVICTISLWNGDEWVSRSDGAGATQFEGEKGGISDALKRAGVQWGIGRYLYHVKAPWVKIKNTYGDNYAIEDSEMPRLLALLPGPPASQEEVEEVLKLAHEVYGEDFTDKESELAKWASSGGVTTLDSLTQRQLERVRRGLKDKL